MIIHEKYKMFFDKKNNAISKSMENTGCEALQLVFPENIMLYKRNIILNDKK